MQTTDPQSDEWRVLPEAALDALTTYVGQGAIRFVAYKIRTRPQSEPTDIDPTPSLLLEGIVALEGQRYKAEYVVGGRRSDPNGEIAVDAIPLSWEDNSNSPISTNELGYLTSTVVAAHRLVTALIGEL